MRRPGSLHALLAVRLNREQTEEQVLASVLGQLRIARMNREQIAEQVAAARQLRLEEVQSTANGAHHHDWDARLKQLRQSDFDTAAEIARLERAYEQQMQRYRETRRAREVVTELEEKYASRWRAEQQRREQKRYDELFLARLVRDCNSSEVDSATDTLKRQRIS